MSAVVFEIADAGENEVVLRLVGSDDNEALVRIRFSEQACQFLGKSRLDIGRAMMEAGLHRAEQVFGERGAPDTDGNHSDDDPPVLH